MIGMARVRRGRDDEPDEGAAAVEFALLFPIFVMLAFGTLTGGIALWKHVTDVQAARDAGRYGSTLQIVSGASGSGAFSRDEWVAKVFDAAVKQAWPGYDPVTNNIASRPDNLYVCASFVKGSEPTNPGVVNTISKTIGTPRAGWTLPTTSEGCYKGDSSIPAQPNTDYDRVEVVVIRDADFMSIILNRTWAMDTSFVIRYERSTLA